MLVTPRYILVIDLRNFNFSIKELTECLLFVQEWMNDVKLKLNPDKTEFFITGNKHSRKSHIPKLPVAFL